MVGLAAAVLAGIGLVASGLGGQQDLPAEVLLLARIKQRMAENLAGLPNYTCIETVERSRRRAPRRNFELVDTLRLEVAVVGGKELFSWPGSGKFEDRNITDMVQGGAIGNGSFALHARSVFLGRGARFTYVGERVREQRRTIRYDYDVPLLHSGYSIRVGEVKALTAYRGSFWVDPDTLDLIRLEVIAQDIPPQLPLRHASDAMEYARVNIAGSEFLLPQSSELVMVDLQGNESRNRTVFSGCRHFAGESVLTFGDPPADESTPKTVEEIRLPAGLLLDAVLDTALRTGQSATGDIVKATVSRPARQKGLVLVPRGAVLTGRVRRLEPVQASVPFHAITLEFHTLEFEDKRARFRGTVAGLDVPLPAGRPSANRPGEIWFQSPGRNTPEGVFFVTGQKLDVRRGLRITVRTGAPLSEETP